MVIFNKSFNLILFVLIFLLFITGCGVADGGKVTAKDVLKRNPEADIFQYNGFIYNNMTEVEWFEQEKDKYTKHSLLDEIEKQSSSSYGFKDLTTTKLPVGTKIYSTNENENDLGILIVEYEGKDLYYMQLLEG
ncbi:hypothetical protein ACFPYN_18420 [Paenisporosarcina macmurdoensis]|uniref:DUF4830 domain-containing protein n=1 Tax=Paenisporosarcina macmurdoensis TaxID=212659 RepID=A0ABW1LD14_9BACL